MGSLGILLDVHCWNVAVRAGTCKSWQLGLSSMLQMRQQQLLPDAVTLSTDPLLDKGSLFFPTSELVNAKPWNAQSASMGLKPAQASAPDKGFGRN